MIARWLRGAAQVAIIAGAILFLFVTAREHAGTFSSWNTPLRWPTLAIASALVVAAFLFMVATWALSLRWWHSSLPFLGALRVWSLSNLARFIPGAIWQFAGLAALAADEGISPVAATGAVLLQQLVLLATGLVVAVTLAPAWAAPVTGGLSPLGAAAVAMVGLVALSLFIPLATPAIARLLSRLVRREVRLPAMTLRSFAAYVAALVAPWLAYAIAFWMFCLAVLGPSAPPLDVAGGAFVAGYVAGIIAVFAPAGIAVREAALVALLTPALDVRSALVVAIGSRLWMIILEILTAAVVILIHRSRRPARSLT